MALATLHILILVWYCAHWSYILVMHVSSTPRYDAERFMWSEDIMRLDTVLM